MKTWLIPEQQLLSRQIQQGILPHAILIGGMASSGKHELSQWLIQVLSCQQPQFLNVDSLLQPCLQCKTCRLFASKTYPDHQNVHVSTRTIGVDDIRQANHFFEKTAQIGSTKTLIIEQAEKMTIAAANALLKTLEEPSGQSVIVLLSEDVDGLLPTIISRCRLISLRPPIGSELSEQLGCQLDDTFVNLTHLPEIIDDNIKAEFLHFQQNLYNYLHHQQARVELLKQLTDSPYGLRWLEKIIATLLREQAGWQSADAQLSQQNGQNTALNHEQLWQINKVFLACSKRVKTLTQANQAFEFEKLLIDISEITSAQVGA